MALQNTITSLEQIVSHLLGLDYLNLSPSGSQVQPWNKLSQSETAIMYEAVFRTLDVCKSQALFGTAPFNVLTALDKHLNALVVSLGQISDLVPDTFVNQHHRPLNYIQTIDNQL